MFVVGYNLGIKARPLLSENTGFLGNNIVIFPVLCNKNAASAIYLIFNTISINFL